MITLYIVAFAEVYVNSPSTAKIYVNPIISYAKTNESFTVDIRIVDVENLFSWQVNMSFDPTLLKFVNVTKGDFLANQPNGTRLAKRIEQEDGWALFSELTVGSFPGVTGSGVLGTVEFQALDKKGETVLNITHPRTSVLEMLRTPVEIPSTKENGFYTNLEPPPHVEFTISPVVPKVNETVTFDASASTVDAPRSIIKYEWDFGDGVVATFIKDVNLTATTTHNYTRTDTYTVTLTLTDDAPASDLVRAIFNTTTMPDIWYELYSRSTLIIDFLFSHNIAVTEVEAYPTAVTVGETVFIDVTVLNRGSDAETFSVAAYADEDVTTEIGDEFKGNEITVTNLASGDNYNLTLSWDTTDVPEGTYKISAEAIVPDEKYPEDNLLIDGTVEVKSSEQSFSPVLIISIVVVIGAIGGGILLYLKRR